MPRKGKDQKGKGTGKGKGKGKGDGTAGDFGAAPMHMGYFGAWDGSYANSQSGWDGFAGDMGLLTAHLGKANAGAAGSSKILSESTDAVGASVTSDVAFKKAKGKRTFRPCKDFDLQLHEAMRRPNTTNAFSVKRTHVTMNLHVLISRFSRFIFSENSIVENH